MDDWSWMLASSSTVLPELIPLILSDLRRIGRVGEGVPNLADTARAGAGLLTDGEIVRWWGDHEDDRAKAIARHGRTEGGIP